MIGVVDDTPEMYLETDTYKAGQFGKDLEDVEGEHKLWTERHLRDVVAELGGGVLVESRSAPGVLLPLPAETAERRSSSSTRR